MEKGSDLLGKIMGRENEFLISEKAVLLGRSYSMSLSNEVSDYLQTQNFEEDFKELRKINLGEDQKMSKVAALIRFNEKKKTFTYTNLSKNYQIVNNKLLNKFQSAKLKNKSSILIGKEMFFFIYSKTLLINYYRKRIEKLVKRKETSGDNTMSTIQQVKIFPTPQVKSAERHNYHSTISLSAKSHSKAKRVVKKQKTQDNQINTNLNYTFDNIMKPPNPDNLLKTENENILDDLIESPIKTKGSIPIQKLN